jgi:hypothetical protein
MFRLMVIKKNPQTSSSTKNNNTNKSIISRPATPIIVDLEEEEKNFETMEGNTPFFAFNQKRNDEKIIKLSLIKNII